MSRKYSNTTRLRSVYDLLHLKQKIRDYTRITFKANRDGKTIIIKGLIEHFATNNKIIS